MSAAADGDLVLVRNGTYSEFSIVGKGLTVQADDGHRPLVSEPEVRSGTGDPVVIVRDLTAGQEVFLRGLDVGGTYSQSFSRTPFVSLSDNAGEVWIEDCDLSPGTSIFSGFTGIQATACAGVHVSRCTVAATAAEPPTYGHGVEAADTNLTVWDSTIRGGPGTTGFGPPADGGHGLALDGGTFFGAGSVIEGGDGTDTGSFDLGSDGGDGLVVDGDAVARTRGCTLAGGTGGQGNVGQGASGQDLAIVQGRHVPVGGPGRSFEVTAVARAGIDPITRTFTGQPGDRVFLMASDAGQVAGAYRPGAHGSFVVPRRTPGAIVGRIDGTGTLVSVLPPTPLEALDFLDVPCQAAFLQPGGAGFFLSGPSLLTVVAPGAAALPARPVVVPTSAAGAR